MRCLTLADALAKEGWGCHFLCRAHPGHLIDIIRAHGHVVHVLPDAQSTHSDQDTQTLAHAGWLGSHWTTDARQSQAILQEVGPCWLVVDHYALDARWERQVLPQGCRLLAIDDLADRPHDADLLLDQNLGRETDDYQGLVPATCRVLVGPHYALLRPEFTKWRTFSLVRRRSPELKRLLISLGGVDKDNATGQVLEALKGCELPDDCHISVVMGASAPWLKSVKHLAENMPWPTEVVVNVSDMAKHMAHADLAIGAAGSTSWERCCLGVPTLLLMLAENQRNAARFLEEEQASLILQIDEGMSKQIQKEIERLIKYPDIMRNMAINAAAITDGLGCERVQSHVRAMGTLPG